MIYFKVLKFILEEFEKGANGLHLKGGRGYSNGSIYTEKTPPIYGESELKRKAREEEKSKKRKYRLNKKKNKKVDISKKFKKDISINELKKIIRSILYEKQ